MTVAADARAAGARPRRLAVALAGTAAAATAATTFWSWRTPLVRTVGAAPGPVLGAARTAAALGTLRTGLGIQTAGRVGLELVVLLGSLAGALWALARWEGRATGGTGPVLLAGAVTAACGVAVLALPHLGRGSPLSLTVVLAPTAAPLVALVLAAAWTAGEVVGRPRVGAPRELSG